MVDEALEKYISEALQKGHTIEDIKKALLTVGHQHESIDQAMHTTIENIDKDLVQYVDIELRKGQSLQKIHSDLLSLGHEFSRVQRVIEHTIHKYDKRKSLHMPHPVLPKLGTPVLISSSIIAGIMLILIIVFMVWTSTPGLSPEQQVRIHDACSSFQDKDLGSLCLASLYANPEFCSDATHPDICKENYFLFQAVKGKKKSLCTNINTFTNRDLCRALLKKSIASCKEMQAPQQSSLCQAIIENQQAYCMDQKLTGQQQTDCLLYFRFEKSITEKNKETCQQISTPEEKNLCLILSVM